MVSCIMHIAYRGLSEVSEQIGSSVANPYSPCYRYAATLLRQLAVGRKDGENGREPTRTAAQHLLVFCSLYCRALLRSHLRERRHECSVPHLSSTVAVPFHGNCCLGRDRQTSITWHYHALRQFRV